MEITLKGIDRWNLCVCGGATIGELEDIAIETIWNKTHRENWSKKIKRTWVDLGKFYEAKYMFNHHLQTGGQTVGTEKYLKK